MGVLHAYIFVNTFRLSAVTYPDHWHSLGPLEAQNFDTV